MRATKYKHFKTGTGKETGNKNSKTNSVEKKSAKNLKKCSFAFAFALASVCLIIPTTTLAPNVDAFENSKVAAYSVGNIDVFAEKIADNCVEVETQPATENVKASEPATVATQPKSTQPKQTEPTKETQKETVKENVAEKTESEIAENTQNSENTEIEDSFVQDSTGIYLIEIDSPDLSYSPKRVKLSEYDRAKLERLVMGEAGTMGFDGCALVAQAIRDSMNRSNTSSIDRIISEYQYYAPTTTEPNQDVLDAVSFIFDENGSAVQHRVLCFYTGISNWHETQKFITSCGTVRFFDFA